MNKPFKIQLSRETVVILAVIILGLLLRVSLLAAMEFGIESDEAIVGLMGKHILEGRPWPIFYYGQSYMGSLEALCAALVFSFAGISNAALKAVPLGFSLLHIWLVYLLARRFWSSWGSLVSALLASLGPNALILWSTKARGGFIELVVLGTLSLLLAVDILQAKQPQNRRLFLLGLVLGLGWWMNNQIVFYIASIGLVFLFFFPLRFGFLRSLLGLLISLTAFLLGSLPFWYANIFLEPKWATFKVLFRGGGGKGFDSHIWGFFTDALPILTGARRFWSDQDVFSFASSLVLALYGASSLLLLFYFYRGRKEPSFRWSAQGPGLLICVFFVVVPVVFSLSSFGWLSQAPRYLLPLYSVLFLPIGGASELLCKKSRTAALMMPALLLTVHLVSNFDGRMVVPGQPFVFRGVRASSDHSELYRWLKERGIRHINTNYWIGYRTAFETKEEVTFSRFGRPRSLRIPEYEMNRPRGEYDGVFVLSSSEAVLLTRELQAFGYRFKSEQVGSYTVVFDVTPGVCTGEEIPIDSKEIKVTSRSQWVPNMHDGLLETRWGSGAPQTAGMSVQVTFPTVIDVSGVELHFGRFIHDAPRGLVLEAKRGESSDWEPITDTHGTKLEDDLLQFEFSEIPERWKIHFGPLPMKSLRLRLSRTAPVFDWSLAELKIYKSCRPKHGKNLLE